MAYVIGAVVGDGCTNLDRRRCKYMVVLEVQDREFAEEFGKWTAIVLGREKPYRSIWEKNKQRWLVKACSRELYMLLKKPIDLEKLRPYVEHCEKYMAMFIRGLADSEGTVNKHEGKLGYIQIATTDRRLIQYATELLIRLKIHSRIYETTMKRYFVVEGRRYKRRKRTLYILIIRRKDSIRRFRDIIGFAVERKKTILEMVR